MLGDHHLVLPGRGVEHQRAHRLGERLLRHQRAAYVGVVGDRDPGRGLVGGPGEVGALDPLLGEVERVEVAGRQRGDGLGADHHPGVLDDLEHLRDAVVHLAEQPAAGRLAAADTGVAEGELAGVGHLDAHLVLDAGDVDAVALAGQLAGLHVEVELRHDEQAQSLGARTAGALDAERARQHHVDDVVAEVALGRGDEALDALDVPGAVVVRGGLGAAGAHVGAGVGLGEHHRGDPALVDDELGDLLVPLVAVAVEHAREHRAGAVHPDGGVGAEHHLADRPVEAGRGRRAAELGHGAEAPVLGVHPGAVALLERLGQRRGVGLGVEDRAGCGRRPRRTRRGPRGRAGRPRARISARSRASTSANGPGAQDLVAAEHLEEVELDVAEVALVVAHDPPVPRCRASRPGKPCPEYGYSSVTSSCLAARGQASGSAVRRGEPAPRHAFGVSEATDVGSERRSGRLHACESPPRPTTRCARSSRWLPARTARRPPGECRGARQAAGHPARLPPGDPGRPAQGRDRGRPARPVRWLAAGQARRGRDRGRRDPRRRRSAGLASTGSGPRRSPTTSVPMSSSTSGSPPATRCATSSSRSPWPTSPPARCRRRSTALHRGRGRLAAALTRSAGRAGLTRRR